MAKYIEKAVNSSDEESDVIEEIPNPHVTHHKDGAEKDVEKLEKQKPIGEENSFNIDVD